MGKGVVEDRGLDFGGNAVRVGALRARQPIDRNRCLAPTLRLRPLILPSALAM